MFVLFFLSTQGIKGSQIVALSKDLARSMSLQAVRIVETIAGKNTMGIELPNEKRTILIPVFTLISNSNLNFDFKALFISVP